MSIHFVDILLYISQIYVDYRILDLYPKKDPNMVFGSYIEVTYLYRMCVDMGRIIYTVKEKIIKNFTKIPNELFEAPISHAAFRLYCYLLSVPDGYKPSIAKISSDISMPRTTLLRTQNELIKNKMMFRTDTNDFYIKREILLPESWEFEAKERAKKRGRKWSEQDRASAKLVRLGSKLVRPRSKLVGVVVQPGPGVGPNGTKDLSMVDQETVQLGPTNKTTQQEDLNNKTTVQDLINKSRVRASACFSDDDIEAATMWERYIHTHHSKRRTVKLADEAESMSKLRSDFGWDNSFLENLINFLIKTKTDDKSQFSYFWYAFHLKWFLSLTSDKSQRKAESIQGQVDKWLSKRMSTLETASLVGFQYEIDEYIDFEAIERIKSEDKSLDKKDNLQLPGKKE